MDLRTNEISNTFNDMFYVHCIHNTLTYYPFLEGEQDLIFWDQQDFSFKRK